MVSAAPFDSECELFTSNYSNIWEIPAEQYCPVDFDSEKQKELGSPRECFSALII